MFSKTLFRSLRLRPQGQVKTLVGEIVRPKCGSGFFPRFSTTGTEIATSSFCGRSTPIFIVNNIINVNLRQLERNSRLLFCSSSQNHICSRGFRTGKVNNAVPPIFILVGGRIAKAGAVFIGRNIRKWWANLPPEEKAKYSERAKSNWKYIYGALGLLVLGIFVYYDQHIQETPFTKRKRFVAFSPGVFDEIAKAEFNELVQNFKQQIIPASMFNASYSRVTRVANHLLKSNNDLEQIKTKDWTITVVKEDSIQNAFVLPCGNIFVFTGMLASCETDDELSIILAHEMAHAVLGHGAELASQAHLMDLIMIFPIAFLWAILPTDWISAIAHLFGAGLQKLIFTLPYSRAMELEADEVGLFLAAKACIDIRTAPIFWAKMAYKSEKEGEPDMEWFSTHPSHESRQACLEEVLPQALDLRTSCKCPRLPALDPKVKLYEFKRKVDRENAIENVAIRLRAV